MSLKSLVEALAGAVASAQAELGRGQILNIGRYFETDGRPRMMKVLLPSLKPGEAGKEVAFGVPLLTLQSPAQLRIKEVEFRFEVDLGDLSEHQEEDVTVAEGFFSRFRTLDVNPQAGLLGRRNASKVILKVEAVEPSEGIARLISELNKVQGASAPAIEPSPPAPPPSGG